MIYGAAEVEVDEDGYLKIVSIEECDAIAISKELFVELINAVNSGFRASRVLESIKDHTELS